MTCGKTFRSTAARILFSVAVMTTASTMATTQTPAAEITVMSGGAPQQVLAVLTPEFEKATGNKVIYSFAVITALRQRLDSGERTDAVLLPAPVIQAYVKSGKLRADGWATLGNVGVKVIVKQGTPLPDISTPEAFRKALLAAHRVVHATPTATPSGAHMAKVIADLGIADAMQPKLIYRPALDGGAELVAKGEADIGMYPASEVVAVKGITIVGPLPQALQLDTVYGAAVTVDNPSPQPALDLVKFLADPANRNRWLDAGFDPPGS
jgi:molybdate transport system substrate-binding protein